eukprot:9571161-Karenia_brevis.AAC.1
MKELRFVQLTIDVALFVADGDKGQVVTTARKAKNCGRNLVTLSCGVLGSSMTLDAVVKKFIA